MINKIFKKNNLDVSEEDVEEIIEFELFSEFEKWVKKYENAGGERNRNIWLFANRIISDFFPFVPCDKKYLKSVNEIKFLFTMFVIIIDDIVDKEKDEKFLNQIAEFFHEDILESDDIGELPLLAMQILRHIKQEIETYPLFDNFKDLFYFEIDQIFNAMRFAVYVNKYPFVINKEDYWSYFPCTMQVMSYGILELMCSADKISLTGLKGIRDFILIIQKMTRIGNWISTWEREMHEEDFTSIVFAYAIEQKIININDFGKFDKLNIISNIKKSNIEEILLRDWDIFFNELSCKKNVDRWINRKEFLVKIKKLLEFQIFSKS